MNLVLANRGIERKIPAQRKSGLGWGLVIRMVSLFTLSGARTPAQEPLLPGEPNILTKLTEPNLGREEER